MTLFSSLRHRPFALLWSGQTISRLGDSLYRVALAWWVLEQTGSASTRPRYAGRPASAVTATGLMSKHLAQLKAFLADALG